MLAKESKSKDCEGFDLSSIVRSLRVVRLILLDVTACHNAGISRLNYAPRVPASWAYRQARPKEVYFEIGTYAFFLTCCQPISLGCLTRTEYGSVLVYHILYYIYKYIYNTHIHLPQPVQSCLHFCMIYITAFCGVDSCFVWLR